MTRLARRPKDEEGIRETMHGCTYRHNPPQDMTRAIVPNWGAPLSDDLQREVVGEIGQPGLKRSRGMLMGSNDEPEPAFLRH